VSNLGAFIIVSFSVPYFSVCRQQLIVSATTNMTPEESTAATWGRLMDKGRTSLGQRSLEVSLHHFTTALYMCETHPVLEGRKYLVLGNLGWISRLSGKYPQAIETLEQALTLADAVLGPPTRERVQIAGELGTVYRLMDRHDDARRVFAEQYTVARGMNLYGATCRAIGNVGMANYQRALELWNNLEDKTDPATTHQIRDLIKTAVEQLQERVKRANDICEYEDRFSGHGATTRARTAAGWAAIGHGRLSLCKTLLASVDPKKRHQLLSEAEKHALDAINSTSSTYDTSVSFARFFYGRILLLQGKKDLALKHFNPHQAEDILYWYPSQSTPAILFTKEHSSEHRGYLRELVEAGADFTVIDDEGYDALQYAFFNGDTASGKIILKGLQNQGLTVPELKEHQATARLRKGYREIFQEKLRPLLYQGKKDAVKNIRKVYAETIAKDPQKSTVFDRLKYIRYTDFERFGRLPRSSDGLVRAFELGENGEDENDVDYLIFFSYRWINADRSLNTPDDSNHTQYQRMLAATEQFLKVNEEVDREKLCIWMVS